MRRNGPQLLFVFCVLAGLVALRIIDAGPVAFLRLLVFDTYQQLAPRPVPEELPAIVVDIDDESLARLGQWPWPRTLMARLIERIRAHGAAAVGIDVLFPEPDRLSPGQVLNSLPQTDAYRALREQLRELPSNDAVLAQAISGAPAVLALVLTNGDGDVPRAKAGFAHAGDDPRLFAPAFTGAVASLGQLTAAATGLGAINWLPERDQIVRRVPLVLNAHGTLMPGLGAETLRVAQGASTYVIKSSGASGETAFGAKSGINAVRIGAVTVPTDASGQMWLHFSPSSPRRFVSAWKLLDGEVARSLLEGRIALVGTSAAGLPDLRATPLETSVPGIEIHAQAIEQMVSGELLRRPDFADALEIVYLAAVGLAVGVLIAKLGAPGAGLVALAAIAAVNGASWLAFTERGWLLDPLYASAAVFLLYLAGTVFAYIGTERERRRVRAAFGRYLAPSLVEQLAANPQQLVLGGETREMTLMFCDVQGFTAIAEGLSASRLIILMNRLLTPLTEVILASKGTVDKYMGDSIMAFWNAPLDDPDHAGNACRAALRMMAALERVNGELRQEARAARRGFEPVRVGIGLATGGCHVGNMGSDLRFDYSVIGDTVNVASRLERHSRTYAVPIILGESTAAAVPEMAKLELDLIRVKGKARPERIYTLPLVAPSPYDEAFQQLKKAQEGMLAAYRERRWAAALRQIRRCERCGGEDMKGYYRVMRERIRHYQKQPPPANWGGVYVAGTK